MNIKVTEQELRSLTQPDITKIKYDDIVDRLSYSMYSVVAALNPLLKSRGWVDFDNCDKEAEESGGYFDPIEYMDNVGLYGEYCDLKQPYGYSFPTRWLTMDIETVREEYNQNVSKFSDEANKEKLKKSQQKQERDKLKSAIVKGIISKLTPEEMKYVKFK